MTGGRMNENTACEGRFFPPAILVGATAYIFHGKALRREKTPQERNRAHRSTHDTSGSRARTRRRTTRRDRPPPPLSPSFTRVVSSSSFFLNSYHALRHTFFVPSFLARVFFVLSDTAGRLVEEERGGGARREEEEDARAGPPQRHPRPGPPRRRPADRAGDAIFPPPRRGRGGE